MRVCLTCLDCQGPELFSSVTRSLRFFNIFQSLWASVTAQICFFIWHVEPPGYDLCHLGRLSLEPLLCITRYVKQLQCAATDKLLAERWKILHNNWLNVWKWLEIMKSVWREREHFGIMAAWTVTSLSLNRKTRRFAKKESTPTVTFALEPSEFWKFTCCHSGFQWPQLATFGW